MACCDPVGNKPNTPGGTVTMVNVGGFTEIYKNGTGPNPFELRTLWGIDNTVLLFQNADDVGIYANVGLTNTGVGANVYDAGTSTPSNKNIRRIRAGNASVTVTENATDISITANLPAVDTCANVGAGAQVYVTGSSVPFNFRTILSADSRLTVTQNANDITLTVNTAVANEGGFVEVYDTVNSTLATKRLRTLQSSDGSLTITQNATNIDLKNAVAVANEGGGAQVYDTATSTAVLKNLRTITSTGGTVTVTQAATTINLEVAASSFESYFSEKNDIVTTNGTAYVVVSTMDAIAGGAIGEVWTFVCTCLICHPSGMSTVNSRVNWQIETSAGVWADMETDINTNEPQTIAGGQRSSPRARTYQATLAMATPRIRLRYSMSAAVGTGGQVEYAKVSGYRRS